MVETKYSKSDFTCQSGYVYCVVYNANLGYLVFF